MACQRWLISTVEDLGRSLFCQMAAAISEAPYCGVANAIAGKRHWFEGHLWFRDARGRVVVAWRCEHASRENTALVKACYIGDGGRCAGDVNTCAILNFTTTVVAALRSVRGGSGSSTSILTWLRRSSRVASWIGKIRTEIMNRAIAAGCGTRISSATSGVITVVIIKGVAKTLVEWSESSGVKANTILTRIRRGWPEHRLLELANAD